MSNGPEDGGGDFKIGNRILARAGLRQSYTSRLASSSVDIRAAQALRFQVFNLELNEGLPQSYATQLDADAFDEVCDHLLVEEARTGLVVGTYRLQTGEHAAAHRGFYSAQEFDFTPYEPIRRQIIELGRACVHADHRNIAVLSLLWRGIYAYARQQGGRYLIGCSSLTSQDPLEGATMYAELAKKHLVEERFRTLPVPTMACPLDQVARRAPKVPKLLSAYLAIGAKIAGPPAIDREFKTIDFLTFLDLETVPEDTVRRYLT
jgi:putative hemolysin